MVVGYCSLLSGSTDCVSFCSFFSSSSPPPPPPPLSSVYSGVLAVDSEDTVGSRHNQLMKDMDFRSIDGSSGARRHLKDGDVLSFLLDLDAMTMRLGINDQWLPKVIIKNFHPKGGLTPAMSCNGTQAIVGQLADHYQFQFNFGERPFNTKQRPVGYLPVHHWLRGEQARLRVLKNPEALREDGGSSVSESKEVEKKSEDEKLAWAIAKMSKSDNLTLVSDILQLQGTPEERANGVAKLLGLLE